MRDLHDNLRDARELAHDSHVGLGADLSQIDDNLELPAAQPRDLRGNQEDSVEEAGNE